MKPLFVFLVKLAEVIKRYALFFRPASFSHSFVADFWIASEVDEPVELEVAEGFEEISGPILVD